MRPLVHPGTTLVLGNLPKKIKEVYKFVEARLEESRLLLI